MNVQVNTQPGDRFAWLWLIVGAVLLSVGSMQTVVPLAGWLAPVFLLRAVRTRRALVVLPGLAIAGYLATLIAMRGFFPMPGLYAFALPGLFIVVVYGADKWLAPRLAGVWRTLVFPLADTAFTFLFSDGEFATVGASAYTQAANLPLAQLVSITGIWGLGFLLAWFAAVVNELWQHGFDIRANRALAGLFTAVLAAVLLFGGLRLAFFAPTASTVRVAALAPDRILNDAFAAAAIGSQPRTATERAALRTRYLDPLLDDLFARTYEAAAGGAKIVVWAEAAGFVFKEDETAVLQRAQALARETGVYLELGLVFILPTTDYPFNENRAILIDPGGTILWDYAKSVQVLSDGNAPGPGIVPVVDTPYGRLATVICFDADYPALVRQAGQAGADILLVPASDWQPIAEMHSRMAIFRAIENGVALVRPTRQGTSLAVDHLGRLLGYKADYFVGDDHTMIVNVPVKGTSTLYVLIGDSFAYLSVIGFVILAAAALWRRRILPLTAHADAPAVTMP